MRTNKVIRKRRAPAMEVGPPPLKAYAVRVGENYIEVRLAKEPIKTYVSQATKRGIKLKGVFHKGGEVVKVLKRDRWEYISYDWAVGVPTETSVVELPVEFTKLEWREKYLH